MTGVGVLAPAALLACGTGLGWLALGRRGISPGRRFLWATALSPALGFTPPGLVVVGFAVAGRALPGAAPFGALLAITFVLVALAIRRMVFEPHSNAPMPRRLDLQREPRVVTLTALVLLAAVALPAIQLVGAGLRSWPDGTWDAIAIWNARARLLFHDTGAAAGVLEQLDEDAHPDYPLLVPSSLAASWKLLGYPSRAAAAAESVAWLVGILLVVGLSLSRPARWSSGLLGAALLLALPPLLKWAPSQCADLALAYALLLAAVAAASRWKSGDWPADRLPPGLAGWAAGMLAATKHEGAPLAAGLLVGWGVACLARRGRGRIRSAPELVAAAPFALALAAQRLTLAPGPQRPVFFSGAWIDRLIDPARWSEIFEALWNRARGGPPPHGWGPFWLVLLLATILALTWPRDRSARAPGAYALLAAMATLTSAFLLTSIDLQEHLDTALDRLLVQLAPLALVLAAAPAATPGGQETPGKRRSPLLAAARRWSAFARRRPTTCLAALLLILVAAKLAAIRGALGAMWRWPEELIVATTSFDTWFPLLRGASRELSATNLSSLAIAAVDLLNLEGPARYQMLLAALNVALASTLALAVAAGGRPARASLAWAVLGILAIGGWVLLGDALAGASFLLFLLALERALGDGRTAGAWLAVAAAGMLSAAADPTLALPLAAAAGAALLLGALPRRRTARTAALLALAGPPLLAAVWAARADSFARGAGAYLDFRIDTPLRLFENQGMSALAPWGVTFLRELGYLHVATLGWLFTGALALLVAKRARRLDPTWRTIAAALLAAVLVRAVCASAAMLLARGALTPPRYMVYGRALDFAIPAGLLLGARGLAFLRRGASLRVTLAAALAAGGGAAALLLTLPTHYIEESLRHQIVPFQSALAPIVHLARFGDWPAWSFAGALALVVGLAIAPLGGGRRAAARFSACVLAVALLAGTGLFVLGEVAIESSGSLLHHSHAVRVVQDARNEGRMSAVAVDAEILGFRSTDVQEVLQWKEALRVLADLPRPALAEGTAPGTCPAVLTPEPLRDRELIAAFYGDELFLWGPRPGSHCEATPAR